MKTYCRRMDVSDENFIRKYITAFIYDKLENGNMPSIFAYYGSISKNEARRRLENSPEFVASVIDQIAYEMSWHLKTRTVREHIYMVVPEEKLVKNVDIVDGMSGKIRTLGSIRELLRLGHVEDVFIILRTSFEGYIASRYIDEEYNTDILNDFIFIPQLIAARKIIYQNGKAVERGTQEIIEYIQRNPSDMKLGRDKRYFYDFYAFLCNYAHCNFSIINEFIDDGQFSCDKSDNIYMAKVMTLFVYIVSA